jgi:5,5'-dehydrodivanillate O-demethylase
VLAQDAIVWVAQGPIADRTVELLGRTDIPIVLVRRQLDEQITRVERGLEPMNFFLESPAMIHPTGSPPDYSNPDKLNKHPFRKYYHKGFAGDDADRYGPLIEDVKELHRVIEHRAAGGARPGADDGGDVRFVLPGQSARGRRRNRPHRVERCALRALRNTERWTSAVGARH